MACPRCQSIPHIEEKKGDLLVSCSVSELADKLIGYLKKKNISYMVEDAQTLWVKVDSLLGMIEDVSESCFTTKVEREAITLIFLKESEIFSPSKLTRIKTLQQYKDLIGAKKLTTVIDHGALTTHFQPIIDLKSNTIYGYESLARGVDEDGTLIYPDKLFKWAREGDMLFYLDRACREMALKTAAVKNIHAKVFINFIPTAIYDPKHCLKSTVKWAGQLDFDPKNIIFEVVESDYVEDIDHLCSILDYYKSQGFMVALDDIGSGYSSLNMIAKIMPDIIKIDRELIDKIDTNSVNQSIFKAIIKIAKENDIIVLAEGVERAEEIAFCAKEGADLAQGYYFGKPLAEPIRKI